MAGNAFAFCEQRVLFSHGTVVIDAAELYGPCCWKLIVLLEKGHLISTSKIHALQNTAYLFVPVSFDKKLAGRRGVVNISGSPGPLQSPTAFGGYELLWNTSQSHSLVLIMPFVSGLQI